MSISLTESFTKNLKPVLKESNLDEADKRFHYRTEFGFKDGASLRSDSVEEAAKYLHDDDMTQYIPDELKGVVTFVQWTLDDVDKVHVDVYSNRELTDDERKSMTGWIEGQNSDGLGEGFEQQKFAEAYWHPYSGDGPYTYSEVLDIVQENYDNMRPEEYMDEVDQDDLEEAIDNYLDDNGLENTQENRDEAEREIRDDPESYLSDNTIENAKQDVAFNNPDYNENEWGDGMTSMEWNVETIWQVDGVDEDQPEEPEVKEEPEQQEEKQPEGPSEEDLKRIEEYRAKGWI